VGSALNKSGFGRCS